LQEAKLTTITLKEETHFLQKYKFGLYSEDEKRTILYYHSLIKLDNDNGGSGIGIGGNSDVRYTVKQKSNLLNDNTSNNDVSDYCNNDNGEDNTINNSNNNIQMDPLVLPPDLTLDYTKLTVVQLKEHCKNRALPVSGRKAVLLDRIQQDVAMRIQ